MSSRKRTWRAPAARSPRAGPTCDSHARIATRPWASTVRISSTWCSDSHAPDPIDVALARLRAIETLCGRPRNAPKWASRAMDLDVLLFGDRVEKTGDYTLPRPDLLKRPYMLGPMAEIAPDVLHPTAAKSMAQLWREFDRDAHAMIPAVSACQVGAPQHLTTSRVRRGLPPAGTRARRCANAAHLGYACAECASLLRPGCTSGSSIPFLRARQIALQ